jgi:hypothetical protein
MTDRARPGLFRLAAAVALGFVADHCIRLAVRLNGTLTRDEVRAALAGEAAPRPYWEARLAAAMVRRGVDARDANEIARRVGLR